MTYINKVAVVCDTTARIVSGGGVNAYTLNIGIGDKIVSVFPA